MPVPSTSFSQVVDEVAVVLVELLEAIDLGISEAARVCRA